MTTSQRRSWLSAPLALAVLFPAFSACSKGETTAAAAGAGSAESPAQSAVQPTAPAVKPASQPAAPSSPPAVIAGAASGANAAAPVDPAQLPAVVARLDGVEITRNDLVSRATEARGALAQRGLAPPALTMEFFRKALDDILGNRLLFQDLSSQGKGATPAEVDQQVAAIRGQFESDAAFEQSLAARGFDRERLKREVAEGITVSRWVQQTVAPSIQVDEAELKRFYDANAEKMVEPEKAHARHVLVSVDPKATPEERAAKKKRAEELRAKIAGGADFAAVASESSDDKQSAAKGGDLGWFYKGQMVPAFEKIAFEQPTGKLSDLVETRFGYHVIEVVERHPAAKVEFEAARPRIEQLVRQRRLEEAVRARINELAGKAKIEILL